MRVLAGPILRRVETRSVGVWLATAEAVGAQLRVYRAGHEHEAPVGSGGAESVVLGRGLFVHLVTATPVAGSFPVDELLTYDLTITNENRAVTLAELGLLQGPSSLCYRGFTLPSFFVRESCGPLNVLHGSCRKLHGKGDDANLSADALLEETSADLTRRPGALFYTGDQIYADDVAPALMPYVHDLGRRLVGHEENIPAMPPQASLPIGGRGKLMRGVARFTTPKGGNHLMTFGEYAAAHLLAFCDELWPPTAAELVGLAHQAIDKGRLGDVRKHLERGIPELEAARRSLPSVRRVLANIPTYMIFDDHDVTDDWNLTRRWRDEVGASPAGRRVVANALAAYWAFQGWGNHPGEAGAAFAEAITAHLTTGSEQAGDDYDHTLWSFDRWSFLAATDPPAICLDTRTQRDFDSAEGAAILVGAKARERVAALVAPLERRRGEPLLVVSPTPLFGLEVHERRQKAVANEIGPYTVDMEGWHSNLRGLVDFLRFLTHDLGCDTAVVLSGDVHYGLTVDTTFSVDDRTIRVAQFVSSGMKHSGSLTKDLLHLVGRLSRTRHTRVGWTQAPPMTTSPLRRRLLLRAAGTDEWDKQGPLCLSPRAARALRIDQPPDFEEIRTYVRPDGPSASVLVGENNVGWVTLDGHRATQRLLTIDEGTTVHETSLDLTPAARPPA